jgi:hypothetical protein
MDCRIKFGNDEGWVVPTSAEYDPSWQSGAPSLH